MIISDATKYTFNCSYTILAHVKMQLFKTKRRILQDHTSHLTASMDYLNGCPYMAEKHATFTRPHKMSTKIINEIRVSQIKLTTSIIRHINWLLIDKNTF